MEVVVQPDRVEAQLLGLHAHAGSSPRLLLGVLDMLSRSMCQPCGTSTPNFTAIWLSFNHAYVPCASRKRATSSRRGGSAPARVQVSADTADASRSAPSIASLLARWSAARDVTPRWASPASKPELKASPAPTVSTTGTSKARVPCISPSLSARTPRLPCVIATSTAPRPSKSAATSWCRLPGASQARSDALSFTTSAIAKRLSSKARYVLSTRMRPGRTLGSNEIRQPAKSRPSQALHCGEHRVGRCSPQEAD